MRWSGKQFENLAEAGVIDPTKVVRSPLQNAAPIAALLLTTKATVCEIVEAKGETAAGRTGLRAGPADRYPSHAFCHPRRLPGA